MIGYHSLRESKDLFGEVWPLGKSRHFINLNIGLSQSTMKLCVVINTYNFDMNLNRSSWESFLFVLPAL